MIDYAAYKAIRLVQAPIEQRMDAIEDAAKKLQKKADDFAAKHAAIKFTALLKGHTVDKQWAQREINLLKIEAQKLILKKMTKVNFNKLQTYLSYITLLKFEYQI